MERACRAHGQGQTTMKTTRIQARKVFESRDTLEPLDWSMELKEASNLASAVDDDDDDDEK